MNADPAENALCLPEDDCDEDDKPLTPEEEKCLQKQTEEFSAAIESELCALHGPPAVREKKTAAYCRRLCKRWGEQQIRQFLARLAEKPDTTAVEMLLEDCDVATDPLTKIIRPYDHLGFFFTIKRERCEPGLFQIEFGRAYQTVGDGRFWMAREVSPGKLEIIDDTGWFIC